MPGSIPLPNEKEDTRRLFSFSSFFSGFITLVRLRQVEWRFIREGDGEKEQKNSLVRESAVETSFNVQSVEKERDLVDADRIISTKGIFTVY